MTAAGKLHPSERRLIRPGLGEMVLRQIRVWLANRRMRRPRYKLDRRHYEGIFQPGFFASLNKSRFWETTNNNQRPHRKLLRKVVYVGVIGLCGFLAWVAVVSIQALNTFN